MKRTRFKQRVLALGASFAMLAGVGVATAAVASAHTHEVSASCTTLTITLDSYADDNNANHKNVVTTTVDGSVVPAASSSDFGSTWHKTVAFDPSNISHSWSVKVTAYDSDNYSFTSSGKTSGCETPKTVTVPTYVAGNCDVAPSASFADTNAFWTLAKTGSAGFGNTLTLDYTAKAGYVLTGTVHFTHTWGAAPDCRTISVPVAPTTVKPTCDNPTTVILPTTTGVVYTQAIVGGNIVVTAVPADGYKFAGDSQVKKFYVEISAQLKCVQAVTPVASGQVCTGPGQAGQGLLVITAVDGVSYTIEPGDVTVDGGSFPVAQPTDFTITASAKDGFVLVGDSVFHVSIVDPGKCLVTVAPIAPSVTPPTCDEPGAMVPADGPTGVKYVVNEDGSVTATPEAGYIFDGENQSITYQNTSLPQLKCVSGVAPSATPMVCDGPGHAADGSITLTAVEGITYQIYVGGNLVDTEAGGTFQVHQPTDFTIKAVALDGYTLVGEVNSWDISVASAGDCLVNVVPVAPTATQGACDGPGSQTPGSYTITATVGVVWTVDGESAQPGTYELAPGQTVAIVAAPDKGYTFGEDSTTSWSLTDDALDCTVKVIPTAPTFGNPTCANQTGTYTIPGDTGVIYFLSDQDGPLAPGTYKVTDLPADVTIDAIPQQGYTFGQDSEGQFLTWSHSFASATPCPTPTPTPSAPAPPETANVLPHTGGDLSTIYLGFAGFGALLLGGLVVALSRRRGGAHS